MPTSPPGFHQTTAPWPVTPADCFGDCFSECLADGGMSKPGCRAICAQDCGGVPHDPGPVAAPAPVPGSGGLTIYGNYCGPGHGDPAGAVPPVDAVDGVCRTHDLCYGASGYFNCGCDRTLLATMPAAMAATPSPAARVAGAAVIAYFSHSPCVCPTMICHPLGPCVTVPVPGLGGSGPC